MTLNAKPDRLTKGLAVTGTILVWLPLLAPVLLAAVALIARGRFLFDYLMPAELFPAAFAGGGLLLWAALRSRAYVMLVGWGLGLATAMLIGGQALAVATGLASGATEPMGWPWLLVLGSLALYTLGILAVAVAGLLLLRELFGAKKPATDRRSPAGPD